MTPPDAPNERSPMNSDTAPTSPQPGPIGPATAAPQGRGADQMAKWIDADYRGVRVGQVGYLIGRDNQNDARAPERFELSSRPGHTNGSHEPRLTGWLGTTDNICVYAYGVAVVVRVTKPDEYGETRALVRRATRIEAEAYLYETGHPELMGLPAVPAGNAQVAA